MTTGRASRLPPATAVGPLLGLSLLPFAWGRGLATVAALAALTLALPTSTTSRPGPEFSPAQLAFAAVAPLALYVVFVVTQTIRHRDVFLPVHEGGSPLSEDERADPPTAGAALASLGLQGGVHLTILAAFVLLAINP